LTAFAHDLADRSGAAILPYFRRALAVENKAASGGFDPVTAADKAAERVIAKALAEHWPDHALEGEEFGNRAGAGRFTWVIDPIDGTRAFIMGLPLWGTLIGLKDGADPVLGLMDQPYTGERFWAAGRTSHFRRAGGRARPIRTRPCPRLADAVLSTTHPAMFAADAELAAFQRLSAQVRFTRYGGDCYAYCLLAAGHTDIIVEAGLKPYDIVALIPIIERAGGRVTAWDGGPATGGGRVVATGDPRLHDTVLKILR
jgi:myo-inositol-1(or 4)-monophosphatase